jgi:hypothetical protein
MHRLLSGHILNAVVYFRVLKIEACTFRNSNILVKYYVTLTGLFSIRHS